MAMDTQQNDGTGGSGGDWFDDNDDGGGGGGGNAPTQTTYVPADGNYGHPIYNQIADLFRRYHGRPPTLAQVSAWGTNVDGRYMNQISQNIYSMPEAVAYRASQVGAPAGGATTSDGGTSGGSNLDEIRQRLRSSDRAVVRQAVVDLFRARNGRPAAGEQTYDDWTTWIMQGKDGKRDPEYFIGRLYDARESGGPGTMDTAGGSGGGTGQYDAPWTEEYEPAPFTPPPDFKAPNAEDLFKDPNFKFRMNEGVKALERSASAKGTLLTGGTLKDISGWVSDFSSDEYGKLYDRALNEDQMRYGRSANEYDISRDNSWRRYGVARENFYANQDRPWGKLMDLTGVGMQALNGWQGQNSGYASGYGNTTMGGAQASNNYGSQGANAAAAGHVGSANAWNRGAAAIGSGIMTGAGLLQLHNQQRSGA